MKKLIIVSTVTFLVAAGVNAQTTELLAKNDVQNETHGYAIKVNKREEKKELRRLRGTEVSYFARHQFYRDFGNVPVSKWERTDNYDEATYTLNGHTFTAFYDDDGSLIGTTSNKTFSDLPVNAQKYINKKYGEYTVTNVLFYDDNEYNDNDDLVLWDQPTDGEDSYFIELTKDNKKIVLKVGMDGFVSFFTQI